MNQTPTTTAIDLVAVSRDVILRGQAHDGGYVASPNFSQYGFGWLRDGAYCALAMDAVGERDSATRFHRWIASLIEARRDRIEALVAALDDGVPVAQSAMLPTRYLLDGSEEGDEEHGWPNFQLDGYGTWLFALHSHFAGSTPSEFTDAARLAARYLQSSWRLPCYDYWEEFGDRVHTSTLAAIAAGLRAAARVVDEPSFDHTADEIVAFLRTACVSDGAFVKGPDDDRVDASLVSLRVPFGLVPDGDPVFARTIDRIRAELSSPTGGIRRYVGDDYFGGSPWILLTAWLGWHERLIGDAERAVAAREWIEQNAQPNGELPEQVVTEPQKPEQVTIWEERWGTVATPLLWSHAKYLLLEFGPEVAEWN